MRATASHIKLGLLALLGAGALAIVFVALGLARRDVVVYHTFFDESVHGLTDGAVVKFRGVRVGKVTSIGIAPDGTLVDVEMAIDGVHARQLELERIAPELRARLVLAGISGVKLVDIDYADKRTPSPLALGFPAPAHYIASRPSLLTAIEADTEVIAHRLPVLIEEATKAIVAVREGVADARRAFSGMRSTVASIGRVSRAFERQGVTRSIARAMTSVNEMGRSTAHMASELEDTVRDISDAARSLRELLFALEREPDMLLKGRARER